MKAILEKVRMWMLLPSIIGLPSTLSLSAAALEEYALTNPPASDQSISDANWVKLPGSYGGLQGTAVDGISATALDSAGNLYVGGSFAGVGLVPATNIAKWDGSNWSALSSGVNDRVFALVTSGTDVYAGGAFTTAGGISANYIAKWNGSAWAALGPGVSSTLFPANIPSVAALAFSGSDLIVGGGFDRAGGIPAHSIARWNGSSWAALGSGNVYVSSLAISGSDIYQGGSYGIFKWSGTGWTMLGGSAVNWRSVNALATSGTNVYAGGFFSTGNIDYYVVKWNGSSWAALGSLNAPVWALAVSGSVVYAGGWFTTADSATVNCIAKWNGTSWAPLGSGTDAPVYALTVSGNDMFVGGAFSSAGRKPSSHIAKVYLRTLPTLSVLHSPAGVMVSWPSADTTDFVLEQTSNPATPKSWTTNIASVADSGGNKSVKFPPTNSPDFFRLRRQ